MEKRTYQGTRIHTHHFQTHHQRNLIRRMIAISVNQIKSNAIIRKSNGKTRNMNHQTHHRVAILIRPMIVITDANDVRGRAIGKIIR